MSGDEFQGGKGGGPTPFVNAFDHPQLNSLRYNTSQEGSVVPIVYGTTRIGINLIEMFGQGGGLGKPPSKGGKGLGGSGGKKKGSGQNYSVWVAFALCQGGPDIFGGQISVTATGHLSGYNAVWANGSIAGFNKTALNFHSGTDGQAVDSGFASNPGADQPVINYSGTAYVTGTPMFLGSSPALPNIQFEVSGFCRNSLQGYANDANPAYIVQDMLTNPRYGAGFPRVNLDTTGLEDFTLYCTASQIAMSVAFDREQPAARWLENIAELTVCAVVWSGTTLRLIPYADKPVTANTFTWTPNLTWQYSLTDADFIRYGGDTDPVTIERSDPSKATNWLALEYMNELNNYNPAIIADWEQAAIDEYGLRNEPVKQAHEFTNPTSTATSSIQLLRRKQYIRNTYKFKLGWRFSRLEPMDIVLLTDSTTGLWLSPARIIQIDEDDNGELAVTAEEIPGYVVGNTLLPSGSGSAVTYEKQTTAGGGYNMLNDPGATNPPVIFEPTPPLTGDRLQVWLVASGGPDWGGCQVWVSLDDTTYTMLGNVYAGARQGLLTATLPNHADPDTVDTLSVDLTMSQGQLLSGTQDDADSYVTLCYVDGELLSYETATLTSTYNYDLTYLRRGAYGTTISAHVAGTQFARFGLDNPSLFKYTYPASYIGRTIYIKLPAFNTFGLELEDISGVTAYAYVLTGAGTLLPSFEVPGAFSGRIGVASAYVERFEFASGVTFPTNFSGSRAVATVAATANTAYLIRRNKTETVGSINFLAGSTSGIFSTTATAGFPPGSSLQIEATSDATLAGVAWNLLGRQNNSIPVAEIHGAQSGPISANLVVFRYVVVNAVTLPANLVGSAFVSDVAATANTFFSIRKNGVEFEVAEFLAGHFAAGFAAAGSTLLVPGDVITIVAQAIPDATLEGLYIALSGTFNLTNPFLPIVGSITGPIPGSATVFNRVIAQQVLLPSGLSGSYAVAANAGTGSTVFDIQQNGTSIGTMTFAGGSTTATFSFSTSIFLTVGDVLTIESPASPDPNLSGLAWNIAGVT